MTFTLTKHGVCCKFFSSYWHIVELQCHGKCPQQSGVYVFHGENAVCSRQTPGRHVLRCGAVIISETVCTVQCRWRTVRQQLQTVLVQHLAGKLATKRTLQVTNVMVIETDIWIYRILNSHRRMRCFCRRRMSWRINTSFIFLTTRIQSKVPHHKLLRTAVWNSQRQTSTTYLMGNFLKYRTVSCSRLCIHTKMTNSPLCHVFREIFRMYSDNQFLLTTWSSLNHPDFPETPWTNLHGQ